MTTAIIGVGNIGGALARHLVRGGEDVTLAAREESNAAALAGELGPLATAATVQEAIEAGDVVVFAVWFDALKQLIPEYADLLDGKVVADPSNPIGITADGTPFRTLPEGQSQGSLVAAMLPPAPTTSRRSARSAPTHSPTVRTGLRAGRCFSMPPTTTALPRRSSGSSPSPGSTRPGPAT